MKRVISIMALAAFLSFGNTAYAQDDAVEGTTTDMVDDAAATDPADTNAIEEVVEEEENVEQPVDKSQDKKEKQPKLKPQAEEFYNVLTSPIKAGGKLFVIDGGMSKPYQKVTGIAGYTLIYDSYSLILAEHKPFESRRKAIQEEADIVSTRSMITRATQRITVGDTDNGKKFKIQIEDLNKLLEAYRKGVVKVKSV